VVTGANVTITNEDTSVSDHTVSESAGTFSLKAFFGQYTVTMTLRDSRRRCRRASPSKSAGTQTADLPSPPVPATETGIGPANANCLTPPSPNSAVRLSPVVVQALPTEVSGRGARSIHINPGPGTTGSTFPIA